MTRPSNNKHALPTVSHSLVIISSNALDFFPSEMGRSTSAETTLQEVQSPLPNTEYDHFILVRLIMNNNIQTRDPENNGK